jgi:hypothetical protein
LPRVQFDCNSIPLFRIIESGTFKDPILAGPVITTGPHVILLVIRFTVLNPFDARLLADKNEIANELHDTVFEIKLFVVILLPCTLTIFKPDIVAFTEFILPVLILLHVTEVVTIDVHVILVVINETFVIF